MSVPRLGLLAVIRPLEEHPNYRRLITNLSRTFSAMASRVPAVRGRPILEVIKGGSFWFLAYDSSGCPLGI